MSNTTPTPKISEILKEEFMKPLNLSAYAVAKAIDVPLSRIEDVLHDRRKITVDLSVRLGKLFDVSPKYFLNLQNDIELKNRKEYEKIKSIIGKTELEQAIEDADNGNFGHTYKSVEEFRSIFKIKTTK